MLLTTYILQNVLRKKSIKKINIFMRLNLVIMLPDILLLGAIINY